MVETYAGCKPDLTLDEVMSRPETHYEMNRIRHLIEGHVELDGLRVPVLSRAIGLKDRWGTVLARLGIGRMAYHFPPGLYLIGEQAEDLPVLVSCNYKLTLDALRKALKGKGYWLLVLDTKGVNVWCAAGKGTFGTEELIFQLTKWRVKERLKAKTVILPQLGASRMTPHVIQALTGVKVTYGPVRAEDVDDYLANGRKATEAQRTVTFPWRERLVLTPIEFLMSLRLMALIYPLMVLYSYLNFGFEWRWDLPLMQTLPWLLAMFSGAVLFPLLLPLLPGRYFTLKSLWLSGPLGLGIILGADFFALGRDPLQLAAWVIGCGLYTAYLALNFTGSTTFTSFSGVAYEVGRFKKAAKVLGAAAAGLMLLSIWV